MVEIFLINNNVPLSLENTYNFLNFLLRKTVEKNELLSAPLAQPP